ncbi:VOC family protein [Leifsonia shinshuensis]|uniref:VOC family protein n=1 Tax=Leifsonia shinshuensis TaxID=150026 RepID=UPI0028566314|nr:VOC family protein [Leifsonia shinshuensis]MDR6972015.1 methylmalonyl-CoA/ethylmalonyl-CoA epimerase [Leifsonia shinshuensis]
MRIRQIAQRAVDLDRAAHFYSLLLEQPVAAVFDPPGLVFFTGGGMRLLIDRAAPSSLIYFEVDDVDAAVERMRPHATITTEPHVIFRHDDDTLGPAGQEEVHAFLTDSEGNTVGLIGFRSVVPAQDDRR